jgi:hypothetical protein
MFVFLCLGNDLAEQPGNRLAARLLIGVRQLAPTLGPHEVKCLLPGSKTVGEFPQFDFEVHGDLLSPSSNRMESGLGQWGWTADR